MFWPMNGLGPQRPGAGSEQNDEEEEEGADHLEENNVSHATEGPEKTAEATRDAAGGASGGAPGSTHSIRDTYRIDGYRPRRSSRAALRLLRASGQSLAGHAADHAHADAQNPADGLWIHTRL